MPDLRANAVEYALNNKTRFLDDLKQLVSIPSVSTHAHNQTDMTTAAEWLAARLSNLGFQKVQVMPTDGHPIVYGEWTQAGPDAQTVLIYGHYDVQPAEPLELWKTPPFEGTQRDDYLFGRGASDMKGQVIASLSAVESVLRQGPLPVNVKFHHRRRRGDWLAFAVSLPGGKQGALLACDVAVNPDAGMIAPDVPTIVYGLRGLAYFELRVLARSQDLHSGLFGGVAHNPAQVLCELIAGMHDKAGPHHVARLL
jgi:acetylornithine deacetylase/succinyl-diaminopimelate desuccinylase-like protein